MPRLALFTTECAQLAEAVTEIIEQHHGDLAVVVTSDIYGGSRGGLLRQTARNLRRHGPGFVRYLFYGFALYPAYLTVDRLRARLRGGRRTRYGVAELCERYGIRHIHTATVNRPEVVAELGRADLDVIVVYWFDQILRERVIAAPKHTVVNVHAGVPAALPRAVPHAVLRDRAGHAVRHHRAPDPEPADRRRAAPGAADLGPAARPRRALQRQWGEPHRRRPAGRGAGGPRLAHWPGGAAGRRHVPLLPDPGRPGRRPAGDPAQPGADAA
ncbi:MAG TPA: hypothetical protein VLJ59_19570 [Mycobacteriales bacterium]|nr:hypothetical protein [Mycobacteriales bacterium]